MAGPQTLRALNEIIITCTRCPRLTVYREQVAREKKRMYRGEEYWGKPVPGWGDTAARVYIVGLAPAAHGGNRTGRVFTKNVPVPFMGVELSPERQIRHVTEGLKNLAMAHPSGLLPWLLRMSRA